MDRMPKSSSSGSPGRVHETILVVEDERLMLRLLEKFLSKHGYHVLLASDGQQAIDIYRCYKRQIDAVLLDMRLPISTGEEVFHRMKEENAAVKVVIASGYLEGDIKTRMSFAGVKRFVSKPYVLDELVEVFRKVIENE